MNTFNQIWQNGSMEQFIESGTPSFLIGLSLNNSYFSQENIEKIISWCDEPQWAVSNAIMIPDEPSIHTMVASGVVESSVRSITRRKANALENKCRKVKTKNELKIYRWSEVKDQIPYKISLDLMRSIFTHNSKFRRDCLNTTREVISKKNRNPSESQLIEGTQFLLEELAFVYSSRNIIGAGSVCYVYHKKLDVLYYLLSGQYFIPSTDEIFSLILSQG